METKKSVTKRQYRRNPKMLSDLDTKKILKDLDKPISILVGLAAGVPIAIAVEKFAGQKSTVSGLFGIDGKKLTRLLKPTVNIALGMSIHQLAKNPRVKLAGIGLAANGGMIAVKDFLGKDILKGFEDVGQTPDKTETIRVIERVLDNKPSPPLNLPVIPIEEDIDNTESEYIDQVVEGAPKQENISGNAMEGVNENVGNSPSTNYAKEEDEIILSSDREEDNYTVEKAGEEEMEGTIEAPIINTPEPNMDYIPDNPGMDDNEEDLDFSSIP